MSLSYDQRKTLNAKLGRKTARNIVYNSQWSSASFGRYRRLRWIENASRGLRIFNGKDAIVKDALSWRSRDESAWYVDHFWSDVTEAHIVMLPHGRMYPATSDPWNIDCYVVDFADTYEDVADCWRDACGLAESYAEYCRDDNAKQIAQQDIDDAREQIATERDEASAILREIRRLAGAVNSPIACAALKAQVARHHAVVRKAIKTIRARRDNYWSAVQDC